MPSTVRVEGADAEQVTDHTVKMIGGLLFRPMERLTGIVLMVAFEGHLCDRDDRVREVVQDTGEEWGLLPLGRIIRQNSPLGICL